MRILVADDLAAEGVEALERGGEPRLIQTVRGVGYVLREPA